ncbi:MAG: hypothetical protein J6J38_13300 [Lachnospiraceae bacterium]|nr:hypothetical protein [Lachnospiraceae bacterium]
MKKELQKKLSFVLFVMAVFFAGVALTVFSSSIVVVCIAGVLLLAAAVFFVLQQDTKSQTPSGKTSEILLADRMAELMRGNEKAEKGVYIAVKKQHEAMEAGLTALEEKISELIKSQDNAVKTLVLYNKENAKQMALSEKEELGRLREELVQAQGGKGNSGAMSQIVDAVKDMSRRLYEEFHENGEAILAELETSTDSLEEIKELLQGIGSGSVPPYVPVAPAPEAVVVPEPVFEEPEEAVVQEPVFEEPEETVVEETPFIPEDIPAEPVVEESPVVSEDPNRMLSADDIAALFAAAETTEESVVEEAPAVTEEPIAEETPVKKNPEDALASSGVDLSDPNKTLSPDDIAALIAALGN